MAPKLAVMLLAFFSAFSLVAVDFAEARKRGGGGGRGGGASAHSRGGGGGGGRAGQRWSSSPRQPSSRDRRGGDFSGGGFRQGDRQGTRQGTRGDRQGDRAGQRGDRQGSRGDRQGTRQGTRGDRQGDRGDRQGDRQGNRGDRQGDRQGNRGDRQGDRRDNWDDRRDDRWDRRDDIRDDIHDNHYWGHHHNYYGHGYHGSYWGNDAWAWAAFTGLAIGVLIATLPPRYETVVVTGTTYYYANGTYYILVGNQYQVVPAPVNVVVVNPPAEISVVTVDDTQYGYSNGAYYVAEAPAEDTGDPTFRVIAPPVGATVTELPEDAEKRSAGGQDYFVYNDTWYQPFYSGSNAVYVVVETQRHTSQSSQLTIDIQRRLRDLGYNPGPADGIYGSKTKAAIEAFQRKSNLPVDGQPSQALLDQLERVQ
jgi:hypothetical protein